jgi:hypothetical protein
LIRRTKCLLQGPDDDHRFRTTQNIADASAFTMRNDKVLCAQSHELLRDCGLTEAETGRDLTDGPAAIDQQAQDLQPPFMGKKLEERCGLANFQVLRACRSLRTDGADIP